MSFSSGNSKNRSALFVVLAVVVLLIFVVVGLRFGSMAVMSPIEHVFMDFTGYLQKGLSGPPRWGKHIWQSYLSLQDVKMENEGLRQEVARLQQEIVQYREALIANTRLKKLLEIKERVKTTTVTANVVGVDIAPWVATITVDYGRKDGIMPGMVVLSGAGVVGQVVESSLYFSTVLLLSDYNSAVAAIIQRNRENGLLKGDGESQCRLAYVDKEVDVEVGDEIITSGTDKVFPKGLLLGNISSVTKGPISGLFQVITVTPAVDLKKIEEVIILVTGKPLIEATQ